MKNHLRQFARKVGKATAKEMFDQFQNPKFRGPKFTWSGFPKMVARLANGYVGLSCKDWDKLHNKDRNKLRDIAANAAKCQAEILVKTLTIST